MMSEIRPEKRKIEFIESSWTGGEFGSNYQWNDNHGELIRCKDCKHGHQCEFDIKCENEGNPQMFGTRHKPDWYCYDGERKDDK